MPAGEVIANYHDLWHVEQSFRMSKTDLRARPMFHHTRDAIEDPFACPPRRSQRRTVFASRSHALMGARQQ